LDDQTGE